MAQRLRQQALIPPRLVGSGRFFALLRSRTRSTLVSSLVSICIDRIQSYLTGPNRG